MNYLHFIHRHFHLLSLLEWFLTRSYALMVCSTVFLICLFQLISTLNVELKMFCSFPEVLYYFCGNGNIIEISWPYDVNTSCFLLQELDFLYQPSASLSKDGNLHRRIGVVKGARGHGSPKIFSIYSHFVL